MLNSSKCVLLLSDEGLNIYTVTSGRASFVDGIPWETDDFEESVAGIMRKKCKGKPVILFNDMVEQHYRKERVPKVSPFDKANVIKRRLSASFPSYPLRAAMKLKERVTAKSKEGAGLNGDLYLFTAVPLSDNIRKTLNAMKKCQATIAGFTLLPLESSSMVHMLSKKLVKVNERPATWTVFVGQHHNGGLRQVVTRNGELALTRMTPIAESDIDQELWSNDVAAEIKGTMSYLSRFGYDPRDGLDIIVVSNNSTADRLASKIDVDCNLNILTAAEVGNLLGLKIGAQNEQRYADPLHVAWVGKKSKLTLPMKSNLLDQITQPAQIAMLLAVGLIVACGYLGYLTFNSAATWSDTRKDLQLMENTLAETKVEHEEEVKRKAAIGINFLLIEASTQIFRDLELGAMKPLYVLKTIGTSLGADLHIKSLDIQPVVTTPPPNADGSIPEPVPEPTIGDVGTPKEYNIVIKITFPGELEPELGVKKINELEQRLKANLPDHRVNIIKQVADLSYTGNFVGEATSRGQQAGIKEDYEAQIMISGLLAEPLPAPSVPAAAQTGGGIYD